MSLKGGRTGEEKEAGGRVEGLVFGVSGMKMPVLRFAARRVSGWRIT